MRKSKYLLVTVLVVFVFTTDSYALFGKKKAAVENKAVTENGRVIDEYKKKEMNELINDFYKKVETVDAEDREKPKVENVRKKVKRKKDITNLTEPVVVVGDDFRNRGRRRIIEEKRYEKGYKICKSCKRRFSINDPKIFCPYDGEKLRIVRENE